MTRPVYFRQTFGMRMAQYGAHTPKGAPATGPRPPAATGEWRGVAEWRGSWRPRVQQCTTAHPHARVWHLCDLVMDDVDFVKKACGEPVPGAAFGRAGWVYTNMAKAIGRQRCVVKDTEANLTLALALAL